MLIEYHRTMLADRVRIEAFRRALAAVIRPGESTVADIGSGTGILGFLACSLGAKEVWLYEHAGIMKLSELLARRNKIGQCHFVHEHSTAVLDPPLVDIIVCETLGNYAYEECIIDTLEDARRFLKPGGMILPRGITQYIQPVTCARYFEELTVWDQVGQDYGLDFSLARHVSLNNIYVRSFKPDELLQHHGPAQVWDKVDFRAHNTSDRAGRVHWQLQSDAMIYGFAVWWACELTADISLSTAPDAPRTHWEQLYFPVRRPLPVRSGEKLQVALNSRSTYEAGTDLQWRVELHTAEGRLRHAQLMDLRKGYLQES